MIIIVYTHITESIIISPDAPALNTDRLLKQILKSFLKENLDG